MATALAVHDLYLALIHGQDHTYSGVLLRWSLSRPWLPFVAAIVIGILFGHVFSGRHWSLPSHWLSWILFGLGIVLGSLLWSQ